jgi:hypothetical protein
VRRDASQGALAPEELVGNLEEDAGAISAVALGAGGAAMLHALECTETAIDEIVTSLALEMCQEADAAGVVLEAGVVEATNGRCR